MTNETTRRDFSKAALAAAVGAATAAPAAAKMWNPEPGIKLALQVGRSQDDEDLQFARQLGVTHVTMSTDLKGANAARSSRISSSLWRSANPNEPLAVATKAEAAMAASMKALLRRWSDGLDVDMGSVPET